MTPASKGCLSQFGLTDTIEAFFLFTLPGTAISVQQVPVIAFLFQDPKRTTARCVNITLNSIPLCICPIVSEDPISWFHFHRSREKRKNHMWRVVKERKHRILPGNKKRLKTQHMGEVMTVL